MSVRTTQRGLAFYQPAPEVDDPFEYIPGGKHHFTFVYDSMHSFLPVDPAKCIACQSRVYRQSGCVNGHKRLGMCGSERCLLSAVPSGRENDITIKD